MHVKGILVIGGVSTGSSEHTSAPSSNEMMSLILMVRPERVDTPDKESLVFVSGSKQSRGRKTSK